MRPSWPFVVLCLGLVGAGIAALSLGHNTEAGVLLGIAGGQILPSPMRRQ